MGHRGKLYADDAMGTYLVRGDNVVLIGTLDAERSQVGMNEVDLETVVQAQREEKDGDDGDESDEDDESDDESEDEGIGHKTRATDWNFD